MQQQMLIQDEEAVELRETFTSLQQEVEAKTKKLKKVNVSNKCMCSNMQHRITYIPFLPLYP